MQKAYDQGLACRYAIIDKTNTLVTDNGKELKLGEYIDDAYIICLTSDYYPAVTHQVDVYLQKQPQDPHPLAMSIFDLDIITVYLKDPFELLYYLRQRVELTAHFKADSEMVLLAYHLRSKLFPRPNCDREALDASWAQLVDANFTALRGNFPKTSAMDKLHHKWKNEKFEQLVRQVKSTGQPGFTDALYFLYDIAGDSADNLIRMIEETKQKTLRDNRRHDFSMIFDNGKHGVTFVCLPSSPENLENCLMSLAMAKKYKTKADVWLGLGWVAESPNVIDAIAFNKQPWTQDRNLEEVSKVILKTGKAVNMKGAEIGRNDPCPCGSGRKFKKCCGT